MRATLALALILTACGDNHQGTKLTLEDVSASTAEDTPLDVTVPLTANEPNAVTLSIVTQPTNGTITGAGPEWTYTPNANYNGSDSFTVSATERSNTVQATVTINVTAVNDLPVAVTDTTVATTNEDTSATIAASALLTNDTDVEASTLTVASVTAGANTHGTVTLAGTDITYSPDANFNGTAEFTYEVSDGTGTSTGTVTVTVTAVQDAPTATNDTLAATEDTVLTFPSSMLTSNDLEVDNETMTVTSVTAGAGTNGTVVLAAVGGNITWTGTLNFNGSATFDYEVSDGVGGTDTATVTLTVAAVDDPSVPVGDSATVAEDSTNNAIMVLINDTDVDGGTNVVDTVTQPTNGTVAIAGGGTHVTYTPNPNYCNQGPNVRPDEFQYTVMPGGATGHVSVVVTCECDQGKPTVFVVGSN